MGTESLRDTVENAFEEVIQPETPAPEAPVETTVEAEVPQKADDRPRDESGRFVEKQKDSAGPAPAKATPAKAPPPASAAPAQPATPGSAESRPRYQRPSTWKKETWGIWEKLNKGEQLNPQEIHLMAEEAIRRDSDFARGVSTYKQEWETAKPLIDAMAPFMPLLQQHNIQPAQWIGNLGRAHQLLSLGTPEQKLSTFIRLAGEYGVPVEHMFVRGQDGQVYFNQQMMQQAAMQQQYQPPQQQQDVRKIVAEQLANERANEQIAAMIADKEKYPHVEEVRETMAGLLQAGLADGLEDAYKAALQHPRHFHLYEAQLQQQREAEQREKAEKARREAEAARRKAVSPRTNTPTSVATGGDGKKGLRGAIEEAFDSTVAGRV